MSSPRRNLLRAGVLAAVVALAGAAVASAGTHRHRGHRAHATYSTPSTHPLRTAIQDDSLFAGQEQAQAFAATRAAGATYVRITANWMQIAPATPPAGFKAADPESPGYDWSGLDAMVEGAESAGLTPFLDILYAPSWALSVPRRGASAGTPKVAALAAFAHALATHYDGQGSAPAVHVFSVWNEPNLSIFLDPTSPKTYRRMVNAAAAQIHGVDAANLVMAGELDPFKNRAKRFHTVAPLAFMRKVLCVSAGAHPHATCGARVHFDVWAHHPYTFGGPFAHARLRDDVSLGDLPRMAKLLRAAQRLHRVVSTQKVQFWATEFTWSTKPPNPHAMPIRLQTRATAAALYQMWRSGVSLANWFLLQDRPLDKGPYQCGLYFAGKPIGEARAKPTLQAFRFPFVAYLAGGAVGIWGRDATSNKQLVVIQRRHGKRGRWRTVARVRSNRYGIFLAHLRLAATKRDWLRARAAGSGTSVAYSLTEPHYPHVGPWGS